MLDLATEVSGASAPAPDNTPAPLGHAHARGLREIYRSAGWPGQDMLDDAGQRDAGLHPGAAM